MFKSQELPYKADGLFPVNCDTIYSERRIFITETTIAKTIHTADEKTLYDACCKKLLAEKVILAWIMKSCLEEYADCQVQEIVEKYIEEKPQIGEVPVAPDEREDTPLIQGMGVEDTSITEGRVSYDIRFTAAVPSEKEKIGLLLNVEAQNKFHPGYPLIKRGIYYCCRMVSSQYGTVFTKSHYGKIKKVYSIWICTNPAKYH